MNRVKNPIKIALLVSLVLAVALITVGAAAFNGEAPLETSFEFSSAAESLGITEESDAVLEQSGNSLPEASSQGAQEPESAVSDEIFFENSVGESSAEETTSSETEPEESVPDAERYPMGNEPEESEPEESKPETSKPEESEPETSKPEEIKPNPEEILNDWRLILINRQNPVPEDYELVLAEVEKGHMVDHRVVEDLKAMLADARANGIIPRITSSYRSVEDQIRVMNEYIADFIEDGYTQEQAETEAKKWVALPGTSEHQIGLAVDISTANWNKQSAQTVWKWLKKNCWQYGFILRYTERCREYTGASVEPWHFRYVGREYAKQITDSGLCLEEWLSQISENE